MKGPVDTPVMAEFAAALDEVNRVAEQSPGFVWRFQSGEGNAVGFRVDDDPLVIFNLTVWESVEALKNYTYRGLHGKFFARRAAWFDRMEAMQFALWWIPAGPPPSPDEAMRRLAHVRAHGPTPWAFTFQQTFPPAAGLAAQPRGESSAS